MPDVAENLDFLESIFHSGFGGSQIQIAGLRIIGIGVHVHPAQQARVDLDRGAAFFRQRNLADRPTVGVVTLDPGYLVDKRRRLQVLAGFRIQIMDVAGLVGLDDGLLAVDVDHHRCLRNVEVPGIARHADIAPCDASVGGIHRDDARRADVVHLSAATILRVPLVGVGGPGEKHLEVGIPRTGDPRTRSAVLRASRRPRIGSGFSGPGNHVCLPHHVAAIRVDAQHIAGTPAKVGAVHRNDDLAGDGQRANGGGVAVGVLRFGKVLRILKAREVLRVLHLSGHVVQRMQLGVIGQEVDILPVDRQSAVLAGDEPDVVPAPVVRQLVLEFPDHPAVIRIQREDFVVLREKHHSVVIQRSVLRVRLAARLEYPGDFQILRVAVGDLVQRAVPVSLPIAIGMQPGIPGVLRQHGVGHRAGLCPAGQAGERHGKHDPFQCPFALDAVHLLLL